MSFQDKYKEYKERQEAKKYFRSNNDQFLDTNQWTKVCVSGLLGAIACGVVLGLIITTIHINSSIFYIICGAFVANVITKASGLESKQVAIASVVFSFIAFVVMQMTMTYMVYTAFGASLLSILPYLLMDSIKALFVGDIFRTLCVIIGLCFAYQQAQ